MGWEKIFADNISPRCTTLPRSSRNENEIVKISMFNVIKMKGRVLLVCDRRHCAQEEKREKEGLNSSTHNIVEDVSTYNTNYARSLAFIHMRVFQAYFSLSGYRQCVMCVSATILLCKFFNKFLTFTHINPEN